MPNQPRPRKFAKLERMTDLFRKATVVFISIAALSGIALLTWVFFARGVDNLDVVLAGRIFRSGQPTPKQWKPLIKDLGLRTVLCLCNTENAPETLDAERNACDQMGARFIYVLMPGDGMGEYHAFDQAMEILSNTNNFPILVHCARGSYRTGGVIAAYRVLYQGWTQEDAFAEMRNHRVTYRDNHPVWPHLRKYMESRKNPIIPVDTKEETR